MDSVEYYLYLCIVNEITRCYLWKINDMVNLEIMKLVVDLTALARQVQRVTNYADAASANPSAQNVLNTTADSECYADLLNAAKNRVLALVGRHTKNVEQSGSTDLQWELTLKVPAANNTRQLAEQLHGAVVEYLVTYIVAHWQLMVNTGNAGTAVQLWTDADQHLRNLSLWRNQPPRIAPSVF